LFKLLKKKDKMPEKNQKTFVKWLMIIGGVIILIFLVYMWIFTSEDALKKILVSVVFAIILWLGYWAFQNQKKQDAKAYKSK